MPKGPSIEFEYLAPKKIKITLPMVRKALKEVRDQLLTHKINGNQKKFDMDTVVAPRGCGMAACIGGWTSVFLLGFDATADRTMIDSASDLFDLLADIDEGVGRRRLHSLFYGYRCTDDHNHPNVAATAINRYLRGDDPWPEGVMPNVLKYKK